MADELQFNTPSIRKAGSGLQTAADKLYNEWQAMLGASKSLTFGNDIVSSLIGASYSAAQDMAHDSYSSAMKGFANFGKALGEPMARTFDEIEQDNYRHVQQVGKGL